ncbi:O-antigen ligase family protein [Nitrospira sp. KM1]|uniref:O-antigen ligase family protein n=1 Tax=Nitrospira sp. KM1 TaxID=1936990 RepID=UPI00156561D5|nr:O-antigen ligase family protein [Nitrospira sp. KM1]
MPYLPYIGAIVGLMAFLFLSPRIKVFIAFFVMTSCFDLVPSLVFNKNVWDFGAVLLAIAWVQLLLSKPKISPRTTSYVALIQVFIGWMVVCVLWSLLFYNYPLLNTLKACRQMIIGFLSFFVFQRLFRNDPDSFDFFMKALYWTTYALLPVSLLGYLVNKPLLFGLQTEYGGVIRSLPVFLPIGLMHFWIITSRLLSAEKVRAHELLYVGMVIGVTALTFTRGIYLTVMFVFCVMLVTLTSRKKLNFAAATSFMTIGVVLAVVLVLGGYANRVVERFNSAVDLVSGGKRAVSERNDDTYTGRIALAKERVALVAQHNPFVGYGFIHEDDVPDALRSKLKYGSVVYTPEYVDLYRMGYPYMLALHSADIGWADIVIDTGIFGLILWILFFAFFVREYYYTARRTQKLLYYAQLGLFLQTLVGALLMFESNTFVSLVQIASFMLAGCWYCSQGRVWNDVKNSQSDGRPMPGRSFGRVISIPQRAGTSGRIQPAV